MLTKWVVQIPFFPPFQNAESFTKDRVQEMIMAGILDKDYSHMGKETLEILSIKPWMMSATLASSYLLGKSRRIILAGDAGKKDSHFTAAFFLVDSEYLD